MPPSTVCRNYRDQTAGFSTGEGHSTPAAHLLILHLSVDGVQVPGRQLLRHGHQFLLHRAQLLQRVFLTVGRELGPQQVRVRLWGRGTAVEQPHQLQPNSQP